MTDTSQNGDREKAEDQPHAETADKADEKTSPRKVLRMSNFITFVFIAAFGVFISIAISHYFNRSYEGAKSALWWGLGAYVVLGIAVCFAYNEYVLKSARAAEREKARSTVPEVKSIPEPADRPWLAVEAVPNGPLVFNDDGGILPVRFRVTNTGGSPANETVLKAEIIYPHPSNVKVEALKKQNEMCQNHAPIPPTLTIFKGQTQVFDMGFGLNLASMVSQYPEVKGRWATPVLVGCVDYRVGERFHQTGFVYQVHTRGPEGQTIVVHVGQNVPAERLILQTGLGIGGDYAN